MSSPTLIFTDIPVIRMESPDIDLQVIRMESPDMGSTEEYEVSYLMELPTELLIGNEETLGPLVQLTYPDLMRLRYTSRKFRDIVDGNDDVSNYFWMLKTRRDWGATNRFPSKYFRNAEGKRRKAKKWKDEYLAYQQQQGKKKLKWRKRSEEEKKEEILALLDLGVVPESRYKDNGITPLMWASENGYDDIVRVLLDVGVEVNARDTLARTALTMAVTGSQKNQLEIVNMLLDAGADVNSMDLSRNTPLALASMHGHADIVRMLLDAGANANSMFTRYQNTSLMAAAWNGHSEIVRMLLEAGAAIDFQDQVGITALITASIKGHPEIVRILLNGGANVSLRDNAERRNALEWAFINNNETIVEMLREASSSPASLAALSRRSLREAGRGSDIPGFLQ